MRELELGEGRGGWAVSNGRRDAVWYGPAAEVPAREPVGLGDAFAGGQRAGPEKPAQSQNLVLGDKRDRLQGLSAPHRLEQAEKDSVELIPAGPVTPNVFLIPHCDYRLLVTQGSKHLDECEMGELGQATKRAAAQGAQRLTRAGHSCP